MEKLSPKQTASDQSKTNRIPSPLWFQQARKGFYSDYIQHDVLLFVEERRNNLFYPKQRVALFGTNNITAKIWLMLEQKYLNDNNSGHFYSAISHV